MAGIRPLCKYLFGAELASSTHGFSSAAVTSQISPWVRSVSNFLKYPSAGLHTSSRSASGIPSAPTTAATEAKEVAKDKRYNLLDKDVWDEVWAYEERFGTEDNPIVVPSVEAERIIGVTDPEDDSLVIWGVLSEGQPPRQFVEGGEFFVLQRVENITRVGDLIDQGVLPPVPPSEGH